MNQQISNSATHTWADSKLVSLEERPSGVAVLRLQVESVGERPRDSVIELRAALRRVGDAGRHRALVVEGLERVLSPSSFAAAAEIYESLKELPLPVVAAISGPAAGAGWLSGLLCDRAVHDDDAS